MLTIAYLLFWNMWLICKTYGFPLGHTLGMNTWFKKIICRRVILETQYGIFRYRYLENDGQTVSSSKWKLKLDQPALDNTTVSCDAMRHSRRSTAMFDAKRRNP